MFKETFRLQDSLENLSSTSVRTPQTSSNTQGRPSYEISVDQLQSLIDLRFTVPQIARLLHVSPRTIERRLAEYGISSRSFFTITDEELENNDGQVRDIKVFHPNCGSKNLAGFLASRNIRVPRERLRQSLQGVDPLELFIDVYILCLVLLLYGILVATMS